MEREKEIEQFAKDLERCQVYADIGGYQTDFMETARSLCYEGYRKADEVRKETAKDIIQGIYDLCKEDEQIHFNDAFRWTLKVLLDKYNVEVDE